MRIYTKSGDKGMTSLIGGERVFKTDLRVEAYGSVDELMSFIALLADKMRENKLLLNEVKLLDGINCNLMSVSALLAIGEGGEDKVMPLGEDKINQLEQAIDAMQAELRPIDKFTIPGGNEILSLCHVCRTVCRRAERAALRADAEYGVDKSALIYLNRLSDTLYTLGRVVVERLGIEEILWIP